MVCPFFAWQSADCGSDTERSVINTSVVAALDEASLGWGVKVLRYELKGIVPPESVLKAMERQITAEREKRALIAKSEVERAQAVDVAEALETAGGDQAASLKVAEQYVTAFAHIAKEGNTIVIPSNLSDLAGMIAGAMAVLPKKLVQ
jgi:regulator of protease activity HflC (stomatin/prohibitin superfamily)